ncbi:MAG TPA: glycosyltransferase [Mariniphaga anaerophila]|uniref:Glycosyltransferase n=1 Tax=Mariniphaga anaerophila TaxID=1484053 RepID=A0A831LU91_9BACT|nr:glycosyltransferase [Mariniphaga anaerophila]
MGNTKAVSVIVPVFNAGANLERSLRSLMNQTLENLEIIVVNDDSTDNSAEIIEQLSLEDNRIVSIHLPINQGAHEARLAGIKKASAFWIGFLDADDFARPKMYEVMNKAAIMNNADIVICGSYRVDNQRKPIEPKIRFKRNQEITSEPLKRFCSFQFGTGMLWNKLYHRDIILPCANMHFPWRQNINEDLLLNIGCFYRTKTIYLMKEILHDYFFNESSITSTIIKTKAYVDTYRAYAIAVSLFAELGESTLENITNMYRKQLSWECYRIDNLEELANHKKELNEATELIHKTCPLALALLASRCDPQPLSVRKAIAQVVRKYNYLFQV